MHLPVLCKIFHTEKSKKSILKLGFINLWNMEISTEALFDYLIVEISDPMV